MRASVLSILALSLVGDVLAAPKITKQDGEAKFKDGQPISADGKGAPILGQHFWLVRPYNLYSH